MKKIILIITVLVILSCQKEVAVELPPHEARLVVNSLVLSGLPTTVHLSNSKEMEDTLVALETNALVIITQAETVDTLEYISKGNYRTKNIIAEQEKSYSIEVQSNIFPDVLANDVVPKQVGFQIENYTPIAKIDGEGYSYSATDISFDDIINVPNYYEISVLSNSPYGLTRHYVHSNDVYVLNENDANFYYYNILLSDELFDGKNVRLKLYSEYSDYDTEVYIYFRSISETYYKYKKKLLRHAENQYGDIWSGTGNPVTLFSNIENGYGIFAGYCEQVDTIKIAEWKK